MAHPLTRILVVDNDPAIQQLLIDILEPDGYSVVSAPNGETALRLLADSVTRHLPYTLVITDMYTGRVSSIEVLEAARRQLEPPGVVVLTGVASLDTVIAALRGGAYDYIQKPVAPESLRVSVARAMERHRSEPQPRATLQALAQGLHQLHDLAVSTAADVSDGVGCVSARVDHDILIFDTEHHKAQWRGQPLPVTPIEYRLLHYLAETPNQLRSYQEIASEPTRWT